MAHSNRSRIYSIDVLRGIAVFTMVCANMSGLLIRPHPTPFRWYGSFAAPLFVTLAGFMLAFGAPSRKLNHILKRSALLLATAAALDIVCHNSTPFLGVDILYLIAVALPLTFLLHQAVQKLSDRMAIFSLVVSISLIVALAAILRTKMGYTAYPTEVSFFGNHHSTIRPGQTSVLNHWLIDGWFPLFPWLGFCIFGLTLGLAFKVRSRILTPLNAFLLCGAGLVCGRMLWLFWPGAMLTRYTYSEVFYPATSGFFCLAIAVILILWGWVRHTESWPIWRPFSDLGHASLLMYIVHLLILHLGIERLLQPMQLAPYLALYLALMGVLMIFGRWLGNHKQRTGGFRSFLGQFYFGG